MGSQVVGRAIVHIVAKEVITIINHVIMPQDTILKVLPLVVVGAELLQKRLKIVCSRVEARKSRRGLIALPHSKVKKNECLLPGLPGCRFPLEDQQLQLFLQPYN